MTATHNHSFSGAPTPELAVADIYSTGGGQQETGARIGSVAAATNYRDTAACDTRS